MTAILVLPAILLGGLTAPVLAPVPPEPMPDPMARGYLGITLGEGTVISTVEAEAPAAKCGLRSGDVIVRVGTLHPEGYQQVVAHVSSFRPGAIVEIEVQRGSARKTFKVKLACRPLRLDASPDYPLPVPIDD